MKDSIKPVDVLDVAEILSKVLYDLQNDKMPIVKASTIIDGSRAYVLAVTTAKRLGNLTHKRK